MATRRGVGRIPLTRASLGDQSFVRDLQVRLATAHALSLVGVRLGVFCERTLQALQMFQQRRGLPVIDHCDDATWETLIESTWSLGSRLLYLTAPHLRGDDVEQLQVRLARLGFNCGKADGIFGPNTAHGLSDFQQNYGLEIDGICGPVTLRAMERIGGQTGDGPGVVAVREDELSRATNESSLSVVLGSFTGTASLASHMARALRGRGHRVLIVDSDDQHRHSLAANSFAADIYLGLELGEDGTASREPVVTYYETENFVSPAGKRIADLVADRLDPPPATRGMRRTVLRETRMPAVVICLPCPPTDVVHSAETLTQAVEAWWSDAHGERKN